MSWSATPCRVSEAGYAVEFFDMSGNTVAVGPSGQRSGCGRLVSNNDDGKPMQEAPSRILGRVFVVTIMTIVCLGVVVYWLLEGPVAEYRCEHEYLPEFGAALGFRMGTVPVPGDPEGPLGIVQIDAFRSMYAAGFRSGDIPVAHHGGMMDLCGALLSAAKGAEARVTVTRAEYWPGPEPQQRELAVPPPPKRSR